MWKEFRILIYWRKYSWSFKRDDLLSDQDQYLVPTVLIGVTGKSARLQRASYATKTHKIHLPFYLELHTRLTNSRFQARVANENDFSERIILIIVNLLGTRTNAMEWSVVQVPRDRWPSGESEKLRVDGIATVCSLGTYIFTREKFFTFRCV